MERMKKIVAQGKKEMGLNPGSVVRPLAAELVSPGRAVYEYSATKSVAIPPDRLQSNRIIAQDNGDYRARNFQVLRTKVLQQMRKKNWNTLAITAPTEGAGKSLVAANLAVSMAMEGNQSVLLVDMDLRKPSIHRYFGFEPECSIHDYLDGTAGVAEMLVHPGIPRLVLLPGRRNILNSSEQLSSPLVRNLVKELKVRYESRIVIFDLPPALISDEVMVFLPYVDCSLLVIESGKNTPREVEKAIEVMGNSPLLGTVLNKSDHTRRTFNYG